MTSQQVCTALTNHKLRLDAIQRKITTTNSIILCFRSVAFMIGLGILSSALWADSSAWINDDDRVGVVWWCGCVAVFEVFLTIVALVVACAERWSFTYYVFAAVMDFLLLNITIPALCVTLYAGNVAAGSMLIVNCPWTFVIFIMDVIQCVNYTKFNAAVTKMKALGGGSDRSGSSTAVASSGASVMVEAEMHGAGVRRASAGQGV
ncbi:hypothetical protein RUND412_007496 [Rhizina undulata]